MDFLDRLKAELSDLEERHKKLTMFLANEANQKKTGGYQWGLLVGQSVAMDVYRNILELRIRDLE